MKTNHTITDIEFVGTPSCGTLFYVADGEEYEVSGEFCFLSNGDICHEHWFDEDGKDTMQVIINIYTYDVHFNDDTDSNSKGMRQTFEYCKDYINAYNGSDESYFADYKGGTVSIVCNETGDTVYEEVVR